MSKLPLILSRRQALTTCVVFAAGFLTGCGGSQTETGGAPSESGTPAGSGASAQGIQADGSSTVYPITEAVAEEFRTAHSGTPVTVGVSGTGGGFKKFTSGEIDITGASRPISPEEIERARTNNLEFIELPVAFDAISVVVHPDNNWVDYITVAELRKIWEPAAQGKITRWSQVRPGWPDRPIKLYGPGADSGTFDYFTKAIVGEEKASRGDYTASEDDNVLVQGVSRDPNALGYFGMAYYEENQDKLKALGIDDEDAGNGAGPQTPTAESVMNGTYQPLSRPVFIYVSTRSAERPEVQQFIQFYLEQAPTLTKEVGYVPLSEQIYQKARDRFEKRTTGSLFEGGKSIVGVKLDELM